MQLKKGTYYSSRANTSQNDSSKEANKADGTSEEEDFENPSVSAQSESASEPVGKVQFKQISVGPELSCGITLHGQHLRCWGRSAFFEPPISMPRDVQGPFKQVSAGGRGICAIYATQEDADEIGAADRSPDYVADGLTCWGVASWIVKPKAFNGWDQISVGSTTVCGVSMESDMECFGADAIPPHMNQYHRQLIIA